MKILTKEEIEEHKNYVLKENLKGLAVGAGVGGLMIAGIRKKWPAQWKSLNTSFKAAIFAMPCITIAAFYADDGSIEFDKEKYQGDYLKKVKEAKEERYNGLTSTEKLIHQVNEYKYPLIIGAWGASLFGCWKLVDRDRYMLKAQKIVQARVYAQAISVVLLLGTILLLYRDNEIKKKQPAPIPEWKQILQEQEEKKKQAAAAAAALQQQPTQP